MPVPRISTALRQSLEAFQTTNLPVMVTVQNRYHNVFGRYWQGIETPGILPNEATPTRSPDLTRKPTDQAERWSDVFFAPDTLPDPWPCVMRMDVYDGPRGKGWTLSLAASELNVRWERVWNFGPETERERDWRYIIITPAVTSVTISPAGSQVLNGLSARVTLNVLPAVQGHDVFLYWGANGTPLRQMALVGQAVWVGAASNYQIMWTFPSCAELPPPGQLAQLLATAQGGSGNILTALNDSYALTGRGC